MLTVDYLLGDNRNRYFGRGYKRTTYEVLILFENLFKLRQRRLVVLKYSLRLAS